MVHGPRCHEVRVETVVGAPKSPSLYEEKVEVGDNYGRKAQQRDDYALENPYEDAASFILAMRASIASEPDRNQRRA